MIEAIIGMVIMGLVLLLVVRLNTQQQSAEQGRHAGEELASVQAAFAQYFNAHRDQILDAIAAPNASHAQVQRHCVVRVANLNGAIAPGATPGAAGSNGTLMWSGGPAINNGRKTCAFDLSLLQARGFWPAHLSVVRRSPETGGDWRYAAIVRRVRGPGPDGVLGNGDDQLTNDAEMLIVRMSEAGSLSGIHPDAWRRDPALQERAWSAARAAGPTAGIIPVGQAGACRAVNNAAADAVQACGPGWTVNLSEWIDADQLNALRSALPPN